jgi:hypothetical protein
VGECELIANSITELIEAAQLSTRVDINKKGRTRLVRAARLDVSGGSHHGIGCIPVPGDLPNLLHTGRNSSSTSYAGRFQHSDQTV